MGYHQADTRVTVLHNRGQVASILDKSEVLLIPIGKARRGCREFFNRKRGVNTHISGRPKAIQASTVARKFSCRYKYVKIPPGTNRVELQPTAFAPLPRLGQHFWIPFYMPLKLLVSFTDSPLFRLGRFPRRSICGDSSSSSSSRAPCSLTPCEWMLPHYSTIVETRALTHEGVVVRTLGVDLAALNSGAYLIDSVFL